jgi:hypothetical protein
MALQTPEQTPDGPVPAQVPLPRTRAAFIGVQGEARRKLKQRLQQSIIARAPATGLRLKGAQWVEPKLTVLVRHLAGE